jgi:predicted ABC-type transport system involved in lysophospholipase L1 biosynthesis ATPase subunit
MPALELVGVLKDYRGLRPLRIDGLSASPGDQLAVLGIDQPSAEMLINLITGTTLPDRGEVRVFGQPTTAIRDSEAWMAFVDRLGIVSERAVLLEALSVVQNLAIPFSLEIEPLAADLKARAEALAIEVGLGPDRWDTRATDLDPVDRVRVRLGRALALNPALVLVEHPTSGVARADVSRLGRDIRSIVAKRGSIGVTLTADRDLAVAVADRALTLDPATGRLTAVRTGWLSRWWNV